MMVSLDEHDIPLNTEEEDEDELKVNCANIVGCLGFTVPRLLLIIVIVVCTVITWFIIDIVNVYILLLPISNAIYKEDYNMTTGCLLTIEQNCSQPISCYYSKISHACFGLSNWATFAEVLIIALICAIGILFWDHYARQRKREKQEDKEL